MNKNIYAIIRGVTVEEMIAGYGRNELYLCEDSISYLKRKLPIIWRIFFTKGTGSIGVDHEGQYLWLYDFDLRFMKKAVKLISKIFNDTRIFTGWDTFEDW